MMLNIKGQTMSADPSKPSVRLPNAAHENLEHVAPSDGQVSILLATYNGEKYLGEQLTSIAQQTYSNWILVAADDGSSDGTRALLHDFASAYPDRTRILDLPPVKSAKGNFFRLLRASLPCDYIALCDQDDRWSTNKLEVLVKSCDRLTQRYSPDTPILVHSDLRVVDAEMGDLAPSFMREIRSDPSRITLGSAVVENCVPGCSMLMNWALVAQFRHYDEMPKDAMMHDWWILLLALTTGHVSYVPLPLVDYRQHTDNKAGSVRRHGLGFVITKIRQGGRTHNDALVRQCREFVRAYGDVLDTESMEQLGEFSRLPELNKLRRIEVCMRFGILKQTASRRIYQLITI